MLGIGFFTYYHGVAPPIDPFPEPPALEFVRVEPLENGKNSIASNRIRLVVRNNSVNHLSITNAYITFNNVTLRRDIIEKENVLWINHINTSSCTYSYILNPQVGIPFVVPLEKIVESKAIIDHEIAFAFSFNPNTVFEYEMTASLTLRYGNQETTSKVFLLYGKAP
jgi:hypothetical protein